MARKCTTVLNGRALIFGALLMAATVSPSIAGTYDAPAHGGGILRRVDHVETIMFGAARRDYPLHTRLQYIEGSAFGQPQSGGLAARVENVEKLLGTNEHASEPHQATAAAPSVSRAKPAPIGQRGKAGTYRAVVSSKSKKNAKTHTAAATAKPATKGSEAVGKTAELPLKPETAILDQSSPVQNSGPVTSPSAAPSAGGSPAPVAASGTAADTILPKLDTFLDPNYSAPLPPPVQTITERDSDGNPILQGNATENDPLKQSHFHHPFAPPTVPVTAAQDPPIAPPRQSGRFAAFAGSVVGNSVRAGARSAARSAIRAAVSGGSPNNIGASLATSIGRAVIGSAVHAASRGPVSAGVASSLHCPLCRLLP